MKKLTALLLTLLVALALYFAAPVSAQETTLEGGYGYAYTD